MEENTSHWEYHPEHVDSEVGLMVDKVLGIWRRIQAIGNVTQNMLIVR